MQIISGIYRKRSLITPKGNTTRPTASALREALFNIIQGSIEGKEFLDLFAGSGAIGFEALSRGASQATFVEKERNALKAIHQNVEALNVSKEVEILSGDVSLILKKFVKQKKTFDCIYADPPYQTYCQWEGIRQFYSQAVLLWIDTHPLLNREGFFFLEEAFEVFPLLEALQPKLNHLKLKSYRRHGEAILLEYTIDYL